MRRGGFFKGLAFWLPVAVLAVVLHAHTSRGPAGSTPRLAACEDACPICATMRSGLGSPVDPIILTSSNSPGLLADPPVQGTIPAAWRDASTARGPPAATTGR